MKGYKFVKLGKCLGNITWKKQDISFSIKTKPSGQMPVVHTYNPSYLGGWDRENHSLRPAWANSLQDPISKK
jgi:hypothetical protein